MPALLILDAEVEIALGAAGAYVPLENFILGNRQTALAAGEMVTAIRVPKTSLAGASSFFKLGARRYLVISIAMAAVRIAVGDDDRIVDAAIAVGACSAVAQAAAGAGSSAARRRALMRSPIRRCPNVTSLS